MRSYFLLDCAAGRLHELASHAPAAIEAYAAARSKAEAPHERALLDKKLTRLRNERTAVSPPTHA